MTVMNDKRAVGIFSSHDEAEMALNELRDAGFAMNQVSIIAKDTARLNESEQIGDVQVQDLNEANQGDKGVKTGVAAGGAVGGFTGLLIGLGTLAIPGIGPIMLAGATATAIATTLAGGAIGAVAGGLVGGLVGLGIPEEQAQAYHDHVVSGSYLVIVDGTEAEILKAAEILKHKGIRDWGVYNAPAPRNYLEPVVTL
jgi:hypothetical protein